MPLTTQKRYAVLRKLDEEWERWHKLYQKWCPPPGTIFDVGGEYIDYFFKMEGIRGIQDALRSSATIKGAIEQGKRRAEESIVKWNGRRKREYQVHRWGKSCEHFIEFLVYRLVRGTRPLDTTPRTECKTMAKDLG
jgi:hypothetical protein